MMNKNMKKKNNKGFSLVELIVVIAIMVVLVAVLAPVFTKYVEQSRRATDVQNANAIAEAVLTDAADGTLQKDTSATVTATTISRLVEKDHPSSINSTPAVKGTLAKGEEKTFTYVYTIADNTVLVYLTGDEDKADLTQETTATTYKEAAAGSYK